MPVLLSLEWSEGGHRSSWGLMLCRWGTQALSWGDSLGNSNSIHKGAGLHRSGSVHGGGGTSPGARPWVKGAMQLTPSLSLSPWSKASLLSSQSGFFVAWNKLPNCSVPQSPSP